MRNRTPLPDVLLAVGVLAHLAVAVVHGMAHAGAQVPLALPANLFVLLVIVIGPVAGLVLSRWSPGPLGTSIVAATMAGALAFGVINHFVIISVDHVNHVSGAWKPMFLTTAVLLVVTESAGVGVALWCAMRARRSS